MSRYQFFLSDETPAIKPGDQNWCRAIPQNRNKKDASSKLGERITYGELFSAARSYLDTDVSCPLPRGVEALTGQTIDAGDDGVVSIFLEKHGAFYHPARIAVELGGRVSFFVLNIAVSEIGRKTLHKEYRLLQRFSREPFGKYLPRAFSSGSVDIHGGKAIDCFLGEWFEGFYEFHITGSTDSGKTPVEIWYPTGPEMLTDACRSEIYRQVARILAACFDPDSFEHIFPWHHAAGDFVLRIAGEHPEVRLITVRNYLPLFPKDAGGTSSGPERLLQALLILFLHISIRTRLDRIQGTGRIAWADSGAVLPTWKGFLEGIVDRQDSDSAMKDLFCLYAGSCSRSDLEDLCRGLAGLYPNGSEEYGEVQKGLGSHVTDLLEAIDTASGPKI